MTETETRAADGAWVREVTLGPGPFLVLRVDLHPDRPGVGMVSVELGGGLRYSRDAGPNDLTAESVLSLALLGIEGYPRDNGARRATVVSKGDVSEVARAALLDMFHDVGVDVDDLPVVDASGSGPSTEDPSMPHMPAPDGAPGWESPAAAPVETPAPCVPVGDDGRSDSAATPCDPGTDSAGASGGSGGGD